MAIFRGKRGVKVELKKQTLGTSHFLKNSNSLKTIQTVFLLCQYTISGKNLSNIGPYMGLPGPKKNNKGHFMYAELVHKILKISDLTAKNAILTKPTKIMNLDKIFNLEKYWVVTQRVQECTRLLRMYQKISFFGLTSRYFTDYNKTCNICDALRCIASLVKTNWTSSGGVIHEKPPKISPK